MKKMIAGMFLMLFTVSMASGTAQAPVTRFYLSDSTVPSGLVLEGIEQHCRSAVLTLDDTKANYILRAEFDNSDSLDRNRATYLVLYDRDGDSLFETKTQKTENAVKDACAFLKLNR